MNDLERYHAAKQRQQNWVETGKCVPRLPAEFSTTVVGVSFSSHYPSNLWDLEQAWLNSELLGERLVCVIVREPENMVDPNACQVHVPALGQRAFIGHISAPLAARLAPELDSGHEWQGEVTYVKYHSEHPDRPGIDIHLRRRT